MKSAFGVEHVEKRLPPYALFRGRRVKVMHQHSTDHFIVLDHRDQRMLVHRNHLTFLKTPKKVTG